MLSSSNLNNILNNNFNNNQNRKNIIKNYSNKILRSEMAMVNSDLLKDYMNVIDGNCIYIRNFFCKDNDFTILKDITNDILDKSKNSNEQQDMVNWSKHHKVENPEFSETFNKIVNYISEYFDLDIYHTRMNFYQDQSDWKPFHHDSHAYGDKALREDFTVGVSFGDSRDLDFLHVESDLKFAFPQNNGDLFAFTSLVNKKFMHGVPKCTSIKGPRISIICWGRRTKITYRNGNISKSNILNSEKSYSDNFNNTQKLENNQKDNKIYNISDQDNKIIESFQKVNDFIENSVSIQNKKTELNNNSNNGNNKIKKKKSRVQSGWARN